VKLADMLFALVALLALSGMITNLIYAVKHWRKARFAIRLIQAIACGFVAAVMLLDAGSITDMSGSSGYLLLAGLALVLTASLAEGIVDL
jgi:hypothetical protein